MSKQWRSLKAEAAGMFGGTHLNVFHMLSSVVQAQGAMVTLEV